MSPCGNQMGRHYHLVLGFIMSWYYSHTPVRTLRVIPRPSVPFCFTSFSFLFSRHGIKVEVLCPCGEVSIPPSLHCLCLALFFIGRGGGAVATTASQRFVTNAVTCQGCPFALVFERKHCGIMFYFFSLMYKICCCISVLLTSRFKADVEPALTGRVFLLKDFVFSCSANFVGTPHDCVP